MLYRIYRFLTALSAPMLRLLLRRRLKNGKEDGLRNRERFGEASQARPQGKVLWLHGASVGESLSALPLLEELQRRLPAWHFLVTTGTVTSAKLMAERLPAGMIHQFVPWDHPLWVKKFMTHWQPDAVLWMESELWPNILHEIAARKIPAALLNARMRDATRKKWGLTAGLIRHMLATFRMILTGAHHYNAAFQAWSAGDVRYIGNLKFGASPLPVPQSELTDLREQIGTRFCLGFLSTFPEEEMLAAQIHTELKREFPDVLTIIAPRNFRRSQEIMAEMKTMPLAVSLRSGQEKITAQTDLYIADTIGEMGLWYTLCPLVVMGKSFAFGGGQNPLEGTHFGCAILYGPLMTNFIDVCKEMEQAQAAQKIASREVLLPALQRILRDPAELVRRRNAAQNFATQNAAVTGTFANAILAGLELR